MNWLISLLISLPLTGIGLSCGLYVGSLCVRWYRISSFEGGSGNFVIGIGLLGAIVGLAAGLVAAGLMGPQNGHAHLKTFATAAGSILAITAIAIGLCRLGSDLPPTMDGLPLALEIEIKLPIDSAFSKSGHGDTFLQLHSVSGTKFRGSENGELNPANARMEEGRWIVTGSVPVFTKRGRRVLSIKLHGEEITGFQVSLPGRPGRSYLEWSEWAPRPPSSQPPWPDTKPSYRFRVQKILPEPEVPQPTYAEAQASRDAQEQARFDALPADAPLAVRLPYTRYGAQEERKAIAVKAIALMPTFNAELSVLILGDDQETAADALRLIESLPMPSPELNGLIEAAARDIADRIRAFNATSSEEDPSYDGAANASIRFSAWMVAARTLRAKCDGNFAPELQTILELSRERTDSYVMQQDIRRVASYYMEQWAGLAPLADDPKPR